MSDFTDMLFQTFLAVWALLMYITYTIGYAGFETTVTSIALMACFIALFN